jgi:hypothetical protein
VRLSAQFVAEKGGLSNIAYLASIWAIPIIAILAALAFHFVGYLPGTAAQWTAENLKKLFCVTRPVHDKKRSAQACSLRVMN